MWKYTGSIFDPVNKKSNNLINDLNKLKSDDYQYIKLKEIKLKDNKLLDVFILAPKHKIDLY